MHRPPTPAFAQAVRQVLGIDDLIPMPRRRHPGTSYWPRAPRSRPRIRPSSAATPAALPMQAAQRMREKFGSAQARTPAERAGGVGRQRMDVLVRGADNPLGVNEESSRSSKSSRRICCGQSSAKTHPCLLRF